MNLSNQTRESILSPFEKDILYDCDIDEPYFASVIADFAKRDIIDKQQLVVSQETFDKHRRDLISKFIDYIKAFISREKLEVAHVYHVSCEPPISWTLYIKVKRVINGQQKNYLFCGFRGVLTSDNKFGVSFETVCDYFGNLIEKKNIIVTDYAQFDNIFRLNCEHFVKIQQKLDFIHCVLIQNIKNQSDKSVFMPPRLYTGGSFGDVKYLEYDENFYCCSVYIHLLITSKSGCRFTIYPNIINDGYCVKQHIINHSHELEHKYIFNSFDEMIDGVHKIGFI